MMSHHSKVQLKATFLLAVCAGLLGTPSPAQDVRPAGTGAVQGVRAGVSQNVRAGSIARTVGGQTSGRGGFGTTEVTGRVVSGKVAGYGARQNLGSLSEYASRSGSGMSSSHDFPVTDFVGTMPQPHLGGGASGIAQPVNTSGASSIGINLNVPPPHHVAASHTPARHQIKDPAAILNPFTHPIGPTIPMPGTKPMTGLGAAH